MIVSRQELLDGLRDSVIRLSKREAVDLARKALEEGLSPSEILSKGLSEGMRRIGDMFKAGEVYMPELLVAADVFYAGFEVVRPHIKGAGEGEFVATMVIGTIFGDVHSVGKDVASAVFRAAGFDVVDLGIAVPAERFVEAIREYNPKIVGLGTYMTSTFMHTRDVVKAIEEAGLRDRVKIICGGPAVDPIAARRMGADDASDDAWEAVEKLRRLASDP